MKTIRFPQKIKVQEPYHKAYVLLLSAIDKTNILDFSLRVEQSEIVEQCLRILSALFDHASEHEKGMLLESCIYLKRSLHLQMWNDISINRTIFELCPQIPSGLIPRFLEHNIQTIDQLSMNSYQIQKMLKCTHNDVNTIQSFIKMILQSKLQLRTSIKNSSQLQIIIESTFQNEQTIDKLKNDDFKSRIYYLICYEIQSSKILLYRRLQSTQSSQTYILQLPNNFINMNNIYITLICDNMIGLDCHLSLTNSSSSLTSLTNNNISSTDMINNSNNYQNQNVNDNDNEEDFENEDGTMSDFIPNSSISQISTTSKLKKNHPKVRKINEFQLQSERFVSPLKKKRNYNQENSANQLIGVEQKSIKSYFQREMKGKKLIETISKRNYHKNEKKNQKNLEEYGIYDDFHQLNQESSEMKEQKEDNFQLTDLTPKMKIIPTKANNFEDYIFKPDDNKKEIENFNTTIKSVRSRINGTHSSNLIENSSQQENQIKNNKNFFQDKNSSFFSLTSLNLSKNKDLFERGFF